MLLLKYGTVMFSCAVGRNKNWYNHFGKFWKIFLFKRNILFNSTILFLVISPKETCVLFIEVTNKNVHSNILNNSYNLEKM